MTAAPDPSTFLSGDAGDVTAPLRRLKRGADAIAFAALDRLSGSRRRVERLAAAAHTRSVLVTGVYRTGSLLPVALPELSSERHRVTLAFGALGAADPALTEVTAAEGLEGGKFENLNLLLAGREADWTIVVDDDVALPRGFLDGLVGLADAFGLDLAQPAQTPASHSAWKVTRRRPLSLVRETRFVEIGPVTAFGRRAAGTLLPFPALLYGWGLDLHWAALAAEHGWRLGVLDALAVAHRARTVASGYSRERAVDEAREFLTGRSFLTSDEANTTVAVHRRAPS